MTKVSNFLTNLSISPTENHLYSLTLPPADPRYVWDYPGDEALG